MLISFLAIVAKLEARDAFPKLCTAIKLVFQASLPRCFGLRAAPEIYQSRMDSCRACSLYYEKRQSCGQPGETFSDGDTERPQTLGCWCYLPLANRLQKKDCWARANDLDRGWPENLRPKHD